MYGTRPVRGEDPRPPQPGPYRSPDLQIGVTAKPCLGIRIRVNVLFSGHLPPLTLALVECKQLSEQGSSFKTTPKEAEHESGSNLRSDPGDVRPGAGPTEETAYDCAEDVCS